MKIIATLLVLAVFVVGGWKPIKPPVCPRDSVNKCQPMRPVIIP